MTGQHILYDGKTESVAYSRTIMRVPNAEKFEQDRLSSVSITPWQLHSPKEPEVVFTEPVQKDDHAIPDTLVRRV